MAEWVRFQKWVAKQLSKVGLKARANGQAGGGFGVPDVDADPFAIECKSYETLSSQTIIKAIRQAQMDNMKCDKYPIAVCRDAKGNIIVAMDWKEFKNIVQEFVVKEDE
jgi:hypothetical protein